MDCHLGFYGETKLVTAKHSLATAIRTVRKARGLSQEAFSDVSSRTYMSSLERDLKSPTLHKLTALCEVMEVHPLTLLRSEEHTSELQSLMRNSYAVFCLK